MPLDETQFKTLIVTEVGDVGGFIAGQIEVLWTLYDDQGDDYLHYLLTKRKAIDLLMGSVREQVSKRDPELEVTLTDKLKNLQQMWANVNAEANRLLEAVSVEAEVDETALRQPVIGDLVNVAGITSDWTGGIDANDRLYRGDAYRRRL